MQLKFYVLNYAENLSIEMVEKNQEGNATLS